MVDREYETSSTGEDSMPETQCGRLSTALNSNTNVNGSIYMSQNGSIIRTRRSVNATGATHAATNNNLKPASPIFSSRLIKHFKKLDKTAAHVEERVPLNNPRTTEAAAANRKCHTLHTFQSPALAASATATSLFSNHIKTLNVLNTRQSSVSLGSTSTTNTAAERVAFKCNVLKAAQGDAEQRPLNVAERKGSEDGEQESKVDGVNEDEDARPVARDTHECPSDRTQSDEEELWMGPWNSLHIPMTKL